MEATQQRLELETGTRVFCYDGACGTLSKVIIDPRDGRITDLIIEQGLGNGNRYGGGERVAYVVPVSAVLDADDETIRLGLDRAGLRTYPEIRRH